MAIAQAFVYLLPAMVLLAPPTESATWGKLTATETLIRQEILRLDGDWESGAKPKLVGFLGPKFQPPHFEMLTHLPTIEWFSGQYCEVDDFALQCLSRIVSLQRAHFVGCEIDGDRFSQLQANRDLRELQFDSLRLTDTALAEIAQLAQLEILVLDDVDCTGVSDATIKRIAEMQSLKKCVVIGCQGITEQQVARNKAEEATP